MPLHIAFVTVAFCGVTTDLGAYCTKDAVYPYTFAATTVLLCLVYMAFQCLYTIDFDLDWSPHQEHWKKVKYGSEQRVEKIHRLYAT